MKSTVKRYENFAVLVCGPEHFTIDNEVAEDVCACGSWILINGVPQCAAFERGKYVTLARYLLTKDGADWPRAARVEHINGELSDYRRSNLRLMDHVATTKRSEYLKNRRSKARRAQRLWDVERRLYAIEVDIEQATSDAEREAIRRRTEHIRAALLETKRDILSEQ